LFADPRFSFVVFSITAGTFAAGCFGALASVYVRDVLHRGPPLLGMIGMLIAAGTVTGSAMLSSAALGRRDSRSLIGCGMAAVGASILLIATGPTQTAALIGSAGMGLGVGVVVVGAAVMLQGETPTELRGRVNGAAAALTSLAQLAAIAAVRDVGLTRGDSRSVCPQRRPAFRHRNLRAFAKPTKMSYDRAKDSPCHNLNRT
jgi:MFS family permease